MRRLIKKGFLSTFLFATILLVTFPTKSEPVCGHPRVVMPHVRMAALVRWDDENGIKHVLLMTEKKDIYIVTMPEPEKICIIMKGKDFQFNSDLLRQISPQDKI